ncbi:MAG: hypothetical protein KME57_01060 [Scytonema hyalinum WJT4-NPBG1]|nr:hypothetical protein [Scytonema hyalinum WJT4-NPBG1]
MNVEDNPDSAQLWCHIAKAVGNQRAIAQTVRLRRLGTARCLRRSHYLHRQL